MPLPAAHAFGATPSFGTTSTALDNGATAATDNTTIPGAMINQICADVQAVYGIILRYLGTWSSSTVGAVNDVVTYSGVLYVCILARSATATTPNSDATHWTAMNTAGTPGALVASNNLSDVANAGTSRTNLGLGTAATQATSAFDTAGAAAAATATALQKSSNLSDVANASTSRTNLGLGSAATQASSAFDAAGAASAAQGNSLQKSANLSDVANAGTARTNLGLGSAATQATSAFDAAGAAAAVQLFYSGIPTQTSQMQINPIGGDSTVGNDYWLSVTILNEFSAPAVVYIPAWKQVNFA